MPIDDRLIFAASPPAAGYPTFNDLQKDQLSLKQLAGQVAIQKQVQKENDLKLQAQQEDSDDEKAWGEIFTKHGAKDWDAAIAEATPRLRIRNLNKIQDQHLQNSKAAMDLATADRINGTAKIQQNIAHNATISREFAGLDQVDDADKNDYWKLALQRMKVNGVADDVIGQLQQALPEIPADGSANHKIKALATAVDYGGQILKDADKKALKEKREADAAKSQALADATAEKERTAKEHESIRSAVQDHYFVETPEEHQKWLEGIEDPKLRAKLANVKFNADHPEETQEHLDKYAMTFEERRKVAKDEADALAKANRRKTGLELSIDRARAELERNAEPGEEVDDSEVLKLGQKYFAEMQRGSKIGATGGGARPSNKDALGFTPNEIKNDQLKHEQFYSQEQDNWRKAQGLKDVLDRLVQANQNTKDDGIVEDPLSAKKESRRYADVKKDIQAKIDEAKAKALEFQRKKQTLRDIHKWDDAPAQTPSGSSAAPKTATPSAGVVKPAASPPKPADVPVIIKLPDGRFWTAPNQAAVDAVMKKHNLVHTKEK